MIISNTVGVVYKFKFELLEKLRKLGYEVYLIAQNENECFFLEEISKIGVKYIEVSISRRGMNPIKDLKLFLSYIKIIKKINPDLIFTFTIKPNLYGGLISKILNKKYSVSITGMGTLFQKKNVMAMFIKKLYKISLSSAYCVFFENLENKSFFLKQRLIKEEQAVLLPGSGVNLKKFYPMEKKIITNKIIFLFIGRIMKEKGIEEFLYVSKKISKKNKDTEFWILGNYEEIKYQKIIEENVKEGNIKYFGMLEDVRLVIKECDYLIQPSHHEGMSNVILEASAMGKLVIASNIPGCRDAIYNKKYLFEKGNSKELENKILEILNSKEKIEEEIQKQSEFIKDKFSRSCVVEENIKALKALD